MPRARRNPRGLVRLGGKPDPVTLAVESPARRSGDYVQKDGVAVPKAQVVLELLAESASYEGPAQSEAVHRTQITASTQVRPSTQLASTAPLSFREVVALRARLASTKKQWRLYRFADRRKASGAAREFHDLPANPSSPNSFAASTAPPDAPFSNASALPVIVSPQSGMARYRRTPAPPLPSSPPNGVAWSPRGGSHDHHAGRRRRARPRVPSPGAVTRHRLPRPLPGRRGQRQAEGHHRCL